MRLAYDDDDATLPKTEIIDGVTWRLSYVRTSSIGGLFYAWKDPLDRWHLWHPSQGNQVIMVESVAMESVTLA